MPTQHRLTSPGGSLTALVDEVGSRIASLRHTATDTELLLQIDGRAREEAVADVSDGSNATWHRRYAGGWHTLIPSAGDERTVDGVFHPFHGEAAWLAWRTVDCSANACTLEVTLTTAPLRVVRRTELTDDGLTITQTVRNLSGSHTSFSWTEHPSFSDAVFDAQTHVTVAGIDTGVRFPREGEAHADFRTVENLTEGRAAIDSPHWLLRLAWDAVRFPCVHIWQEHNHQQDFPWWGKTTTIAVEPASRSYFATEPTLGPIALDGGAEHTASFVLDITAKQYARTTT